MLNKMAPVGWFVTIDLCRFYKLGSIQSLSLII